MVISSISDIENYFLAYNFNTSGEAHLAANLGAGCVLLVVFHRIESLVIRLYKFYLDLLA